MKAAQNFAYYLIGLAISPFITFLIAIRYFNINQKGYGKTIFIGFAALFGAFIVLAEGADGFRHAMNVNVHYLDLDFNSFLIETKDLLLLRDVDGANEELFLHLVSYFVSLFGGSISLFFGLISTIYSYFYFSSIIKVYEYLPKKKSFFISGLFILFVLWKSLEGINTVGTWVAFWVFFNGAFNYFRTKNNKYLFLIITSCFIHNSFFIFTIAFWIFYFFGNRPKLYLTILILSLCVKEFSLSTGSLDKIFTVNELGQAKLKTYSLKDDAKSERYFKKYMAKQEQQSFHKLYYTFVTNKFAQALFLLLVFRYSYSSKKINDFMVNGFMCIAILVWSFGNIFNFIPAILNRGMVVSGIFILTSSIILISHERRNKLNFGLKANNLFKVFKVVLLPFLILVVFHKTSAIFAFLNFKLLFPPLLSAFIDDISLKEALLMNFK